MRDDLIVNFLANSATDNSQTEEETAAHKASIGFSVAMIVIGIVVVASVIGAVVFLKFFKPEVFSNFKQDLLTRS